ncbi:amidase [Cryobacterium sp. Hh38]|uniref:amidase n=1 Tax=Cryobacterium sp. Hh38 TaxID=1259156 RepID=UPI00106C05EA|nr:amidase [Cryobacterium sp. Hh38]TFD58188.1 amidase [Cryobacterium sp. Hh38]
MTDLADMTATELLSGFRRKKVSPVEATQAALERIDRFDGSVNAFCLVDDTEALRQARNSEARWQAGAPQGALDGVPTSIKDLLLTRGWPTMRGSRLISDEQDPTEDAPSVARLREAGAVLIGKTTTPEFGWKGVTDNPLTGNTGNPWDPTKTSGGSSGGSAAAVALGMGALSVGTDGGGSVRIPAAFSGIVGLKPTYGAVPLYPTSPFGTLAHIGPMTRTVDDAALMMDVLTGFDSRDWSALARPTASFQTGLKSGIAGLRIGYSRDLGFADVDPEVTASVDAAVKVLADLGAIVEEVNPGFSDPIDAYHTLWFAGAGKVIQAFDPERWDELDPGLLEVALAGQGFSAMDFLTATQVRADLGLKMGAFHEEYDLLVTPTLPMGAFEIGHEVPEGSDLTRWAEWTPFTYPFNLTQQPAATVPCGLTSASLPIGLQIVGPRHADALVLRAASAYADVVPFGRPPLLSA